MQHWYNLAAKESGLECSCVNNDNFTGLVSGGGRLHWVGMCVVWPSHSKWLSKESKKYAWNFALSLNVPAWKLFGWFRRLSGMMQWVISSTSLQRAAYASRLIQSTFGETSNHPGDSIPLSPDLAHYDFWLFPKLESPFEREKISDHWWDLGKYDSAVEGDSNKGFCTMFWTVEEVLGELCEVPRCVLWRELRHHCIMSPQKFL